MTLLTGSGMPPHHQVLSISAGKILQSKLCLTRRTNRGKESDTEVEQEAEKGKEQEVGLDLEEALHQGDLGPGHDLEEGKGMTLKGAEVGPEIDLDLEADLRIGKDHDLVLTVLITILCPRS